MTKKTEQKANAQTLKLHVGAAAIDKAIGSIKLRTVKLTHDIQLAGLSILAHIEQHSDTTLADKLYVAMTKGSRRTSLAMWMVAFGKMRLLDKNVAEEANAIKAGRVFQFDKERTTNMDAATAKMWYDMQKEEELDKVFDVQAAFKSLMARIASAQKNGMTIENAELIEKLSKVL